MRLKVLVILLSIIGFVFSCKRNKMEPGITTTTTVQKMEILKSSDPGDSTIKDVTLLAAENFRRIQFPVTDWVQTLDIPEESDFCVIYRNVNKALLILNCLIPESRLELILTDPDGKAYQRLFQVKDSTPEEKNTGIMKFLVSEDCYIEILNKNMDENENYNDLKTPVMLLSLYPDSLYSSGAWTIRLKVDNDNNFEETFFISLDKPEVIPEKYIHSEKNPFKSPDYKYEVSADDHVILFANSGKYLAIYQEDLKNSDPGQIYYNPVFGIRIPGTHDKLILTIGRDLKGGYQIAAGDNPGNMQLFFDVGFWVR